MNKKLYVIALFVMMSVSVFGCGNKGGKEDSKESVAKTEQTSDTQTGTTMETTEKENTSAYTFTINGNGNQWENNGKICEQFDGVIKNCSGEAGNDWKVELTVPEGSSLQNGWNGEYSLSGTTLTITGVDYNKEIPANGEVTFGFILETPSTYSPSGQLILSGATYAANDSSAGNIAQNTTEKQEEDKEPLTEETQEKRPAKKDTTGTPFANHGALSVKGTDIVDKNGELFQLRGVSTHGLSWFPEYVNKEAFSDFAARGANAIRLAMYTDDYAGYCSGGDQNQLKNLIDTGVSACEELGLYVIIDWHILNDNDPNIHIEDAKKFFEEMSKKYSSCDNVIYEICNEPNGGTNWESVKSYAETIIPIIRANDKKGLIIVGTPTWSQDVDIASQNPITGYDNILYAVHFYASTHKQAIRDKVETARKNGIAVIISECSICEASGNGSIDYGEAKMWSDLITKDNLSFFAWNLSNKDEQSSLLKSSVTKKSGFSDDDFSETGKWFVELFGK